MFRIVKVCSIIKASQIALKHSCTVPLNNVSIEFISFLYANGLISSFQVNSDSNTIEVVLAYHNASQMGILRSLRYRPTYRSYHSRTNLDPTRLVKGGKAIMYDSLARQFYLFKPISGSIRAYGGYIRDAVVCTF